jgi:intein/homing endonuclease
MKEKIALIYGTLLGDGCLSKVGNARFISITCSLYSDIPFFEFIRPIIEEIRGKPIKFYKSHKQGKVEINFSDVNMFNKFVSLGFPIGKKGTEIQIPNKFDLPMKPLIQGYFATDGSLVITNNNGTSYPRIEFSSISKNLLTQIKVYLASLEIGGNIYISKKYNNHWNSLYRLQINGKKKLVIFHKKIGFINPKHQEKYEQFKKSGGTEI